MLYFKKTTTAIRIIETAGNAMTYRSKLLILLCCISVVPVIWLRTFGIHNVHVMAREISDQVRLSQNMEAENQLNRILGNLLKTVQSAREQTELMILAQAHEVENKIRNEFPSLMRQSSNETSPHGLAGFRQWFEDDRSATAPVFTMVSRHLGNIVIGHHVGFANGTQAGFPSSDMLGGLQDAPMEIWYRAAIEEKPSLWSSPFWSHSDSQLAMAASAPLTLDDDTVYGVTSIWISLSEFMQECARQNQLPPHSTIHLCRLGMNPTTQHAGARLLLSLKDGQWQFPLASNENPSIWLTSSDRDKYRALLSDIALGKNGIVQMPYNTDPNFWIYAPMPRQGTALIITIAVDDIKTDQQLSTISISGRVRKVEVMTAGFLVILVTLILIAAFSFARTVTGSLSKVSTAAQELASGDFKARVDIASNDEFGDLAAVFNTLGPQLEAYYTVQRSMEVATEIQQNLLPQEPPVVPGFDIFGIACYSEKIGGDYFDYLCVDEQNRKFCVAVGDVADHGIPSALIMAGVRALLRLRSLQFGPVEEVIADVNRELSRDLKKSGQFMTMLLARIDHYQQTLHWVRAGHDPAMLYHAEGDAFSLLEGKGLPLGVDGNAAYTASTAHFEPGDILIIGTDGIWESRRPDGEMFGKERLMDLVREHRNASARTMVFSILDALDDFRGGAALEDDVTLVIVKL